MLQAIVVALPEAESGWGWESGGDSGSWRTYQGASLPAAFEPDEGMGDDARRVLKRDLLMHCNVAPEFPLLGAETDQCGKGRGSTEGVAAEGMGRGARLEGRGARG